ncbi:MAG: Gfo/Idh/MocA family oxidoreductase [Phycisphaerales bacterium]|nr:Gfo/Idh/MocA family oxidoreductase [Phycisphaerales bacterium]
MGDSARMSTLPPIDRRSFLAGTLASAAALAAGGSALGAPKPRSAARRSQSPNGKVRVMSFGVGGMGGSDIPQVASHPMVEIAGLCDVNAQSLGAAHEKFPGAKIYSDYREAIASMGNSIDAVTISTPDHHHGPIALLSMNLGKACYCQKPLTRTIAETRAMRKMARDKKVVTQMGIQRQASAGRQQGIALLKSGLLGKVVEIHIWTDRPAGWWEQGHPRPTGSDPVPDWLNWECWLGCAPLRPYKTDVYAPFRWRGFFDFGTGALGDMACHFMDAPFLGLTMGTPIGVRGNSEGLTDDEFPNSETVTITFAGGEYANRTLPLTWYDGGRLPNPSVSPHLPAGIDLGKISPDGCILAVGTEGTIIIPCSGTPQAYPTARAAEFIAPAMTDYNHWHAWVDAILGKGKTIANFDLASEVNEAVLLGVIGGRVTGVDLEYDHAAMRFKNSDAANALVRPTYRAGFDFVPMMG